MSNFCKDCIYWKFTYERPINEKMGTCSQPTVFNSIEKDTEKVSAENGVLHTEQYFGCIYYRKTSMTVTKIDPDI